MSAKRKPKISKPATATTTTTNRKLFPIITVMMIAVISVIIGLYLYNSNKEYQMSKHQREVNNSLQDVQKRINEVPDDPEKLAYTYEDTEFFKKGDNSFYDDIPATLLEHDITPVDEEYQKRVDEIGKDVLKFINTTYHKTWKYLSVPTFFYADEMQEMLGKYFPEENILAFNTNGIFSVYDLNQVAVYAVAVHEEVHYLMKLNIGTPFCKLYKDGKSTGIFLHEAVVEEITYTYLKTKGIYPLQVHQGEPISSSYELLLYNLEEFQLVFNCSIVECMLVQDHSTPAKVLATVTGDDTAYVRWLYWIDEIMYSTWGVDYPSAMHSQGVLNQFYVWAASEDVKKTEQLIKLTNYYFLRCYFLKTDLHTESQCIGAWFKLEEIERDAIMQQIQFQEFLENFDS